MRIKRITSLDTAIRLYYENDELDNRDIIELFEPMAESTISKMKNAVLEEMAKRGTVRHRRHTVNTEVAYEVWGLDIASLERRWAKLQKLGLA